MEVWSEAALTGIGREPAFGEGKKRDLALREAVSWRPGRRRNGPCASGRR
jgi:hypothetical protein